MRNCTRGKSEMLAWSAKAHSMPASGARTKFVAVKSHFSNALSEPTFGRARVAAGAGYWLW